MDGLMAHAVELFHQGYIDCDTQKLMVTKPEISQIGNVTTAPLTGMELIWPRQTDSIR